ncbi:fumarylacetoacetate hydrolase family protein [Okibacterium endophyticum]
MRIARIGTASGGEQWGAVEEGLVWVLSGDPLRVPVRQTGEWHRVDDVVLRAPVSSPSKIIAVGKNYIGHVREMGWEDSEPVVVFLKPPSAIIGPDEAIQLPVIARECEPEGELAIIIGRAGKSIEQSRALDHVYGYTVANDVSARDLMVADGQWARAKGFDTFCPLGPWIETDLDPSRLTIITDVGDDRVQSGSTAEMRLPPAELIAHLSGMFRLEIGDVILTGSPSGRRRIGDGDHVRVTIDAIGELNNPVRREAPNNIGHSVNILTRGTNS